MSTVPCSEFAEVKKALEAVKSPLAYLNAEAIEFFHHLTKSECVFLGETMTSDNDGDITIAFRIWMIPRDRVAFAAYYGEILSDHLTEEGIAYADSVRAVVTPALIKQNHTTLVNHESVLAPKIQSFLVKKVQEISGG